MQVLCRVSAGYCVGACCVRWSCPYEGLGVSVVVVGVGRNVEERCLGVSVIRLRVSVGVAWCRCLRVVHICHESGVGRLTPLPTLKICVGSDLCTIFVFPSVQSICL